MSKIIVLNSSDLAKITGHNTFDPLSEYTDKLLSKHDIISKYIPKSNIEKKLLTLDAKNLLKIKKELNLKSGATLQDIELSIKIITSSSKTNRTEDGSKNDLKLSLAQKPRIKELLATSIENDIRMRRGNIKENTALDKSQKKMDVNIVKRNSEFYKAELFKTDKCHVFLCGKVDGITEDGSVVETKNRRSRLFNKIPDYEKVQMECYMYLTNLPECIHIENYNDQQNIKKYPHDKAFWDACMDKTKLYIAEKVSIHL